MRNELDELRREVESGDVEMSSHSGITPAPVIPAERSGARSGPIVAVVAIVALAVVAAIWMFGRGSSTPVSTTGAQARTGPVAVVGFENLGDPTDAEQFSRMLVGLITTGLADAGGIEVVSSAKVLTSLKEAGAAAGGFDPTLAAAAAHIAGAGTMVVGQVIQNDENPAEALNLLRPDLPPACETVMWDKRVRLLARAAEDAGDLEQALRHFRTLADARRVPGGDSVEWDIPALYDVARLEQQSGKSADARRHYGEFLEHWGDVDMSVPIVEQAREALAALR